MRIASVCLMLAILHVAFSLPASAQATATDKKLTLVPIDRTHVRLALPERSKQAQARPHGAAAGAASARSAPLLPPTVKAQ